MKKQAKKWYQSKTKIASILIGLGPVLATIGGLLAGSIDIGSGLTQLSAELGIILAIFGIRDLPLIN